MYIQLSCNGNTDLHAYIDIAILIMTSTRPIYASSMYVSKSTQCDLLTKI